MSDIDNEEIEVPKEEPKEEPGKKFFLSHLNSFLGKTLLKELRNDTLVKDPLAAHNFIGTLKQDEIDGSGLKDVLPEGVNRLTTMERTKEFRESILNSDIIIYDLMTNNYEEVDYVIKTLKSSELT